MILRCVTSLSQSFWLSRYAPLGQLTNICTALIVRCNTFKPFLPGNGQTISTISITKTSGARTLLTLSAQLSRWKLSRRFQLMCLSLGGLARVMVSWQSWSHSRTYWIDIFGEPFIVLNLSKWARPLTHTKKLSMYCQVYTTLICNYKRVRLLKWSSESWLSACANHLSAPRGNWYVFCLYKLSS